MTKLIPYAIAWSVLAVIVAVLAILRRGVASHEDDTIHLSGGGAPAMAEEQLAIAKKLATLDRWGKILTVLLAISGLALGIWYGLMVWEATSKANLL